MGCGLRHNLNLVDHNHANANLIVSRYVHEHGYGRYGIHDNKYAIHDDIDEHPDFHEYDANDIDQQHRMRWWDGHAEHGGNRLLRMRIQRLRIY
jgi:hypothetical protein